MNITKKIFALSVCFLFLNKSYCQFSTELDSSANQIIKKYNIKGIAMVGVQNGEVIYSKGFGYANETYKMDANTPFYIASNTKAFIGMAMAKLIESKKLSLDDSLIKYIERKYFPQSIEIEKVTISDIISHTTGLSNDPLTFRTSSSGEYPENLQELLIHTVYSNDSNELKKEFSYSNFGYLLCGIVIENITGKHWKDYLMTEIIPQLNMSNTFPHIPKGNQKDIASQPYNFT
jgi:CubicO group peptidase (beta-lactamase class C family)